jgi:hypothetical protein
MVSSVTTSTSGTSGRIPWSCTMQSQRLKCMVRVEKTQVIGSKDANHGSAKYDVCHVVERGDVCVDDEDLIS